jgi:hypothetical protein
MDTIVVIMFGSLISTMTALTFLEVRRIRKITEAKRTPASTKEG